MSRQGRTGSSVPRPADDFYKTPAWATAALISRIVPSRVIWEPACGDGAICEVVKLLWPNTIVQATNLTDRGYGETGKDFLTIDAGYIVKTPGMIITNPPSSLREAFVLRALYFGFRAAFFMTTKFLEGRTRYHTIFRCRPPAVVYQFSGRVTIYQGEIPEDEQPGQKTEAYAWFLWDAHHYGDTIFRWIPPDEEEKWKWLMQK